MCLTLENVKTWISLAAPFMMPGVVLFIAWRVNHNLESVKDQFSREKEWSTIWSKKYVDCVFAYNEGMQEIVLALHSWQRWAEEMNGLTPDEQAIKMGEILKTREEHQTRITKILFSLPELHFKLKGSLAIFNQDGGCVLKKSEALFEAIQKYNEEIRSKNPNAKFDVDHFSSLLAEFNTEAMVAHRNFLLTISKTSPKET
jgi:hypothetical protein